MFPFLIFSFVFVFFFSFFFVIVFCFSHFFIFCLHFLTCVSFLFFFSFFCVCLRFFSFVVFCCLRVFFNKNYLLSGRSKETLGTVGRDIDQPTKVLEFVKVNLATLKVAIMIS